MSRRGLVAGLALLAAACNAPDYTPVRDWARSASLAADYPAAALDAEGALAMQQALVTWLSALGRMADDGVLPYPEDPFLALAPRAAAADPAAGEAVAALGRTLRHATRNNLRAPALRDTIRGNDAQVQALVVALSAAVARAEAGAPAPPAAMVPAPPAATVPAPPAAMVPAPPAALVPAPPATMVPAPPAATRARGRRGALAAAREPAAPGADTAASRYLALLAQVGQGHALLAAEVGRITREETVARIRAAEDQLRRAARTLPLPSLPLPSVPLHSGVPPAAAALLAAVEPAAPVPDMPVSGPPPRGTAWPAAPLASAPLPPGTRATGAVR
jgi:hypothetical protein